jgi:hypothetical protein
LSAERDTDTCLAQGISYTGFGVCATLQNTFPSRWVLIRDPKGIFKSQALLCTDLSVKPSQIVAWFVLRWQLQVTFPKVRTHLVVETQRQWSDKANVRTTRSLLGLFSIITLFANCSALRGKLPIRQSAWYRKESGAFSDALAVVRPYVARARFLAVVSGLG